MAKPEECTCPKCGSSESRRTGAFTFESRLESGDSDRRVAMIVYDRRCVCGTRFPEPMAIEDKLTELEISARLDA